jgi:hypothetical protein
MRKLVGLVLMFAGASSLAYAGILTAPEISPASGVAALALLSGTLLVVRGRRKR